jgi:hypothetical protein
MIRDRKNYKGNADKEEYVHLPGANLSEERFFPRTPFPKTLFLFFPRWYIVM